MKEFDYEQAKVGAPVCTRDGRPARIICWDSIGGTMHIIALITEGDVELVGYYYDNGKSSDGSDSDLMMAPVKREGWVLVDKGQCIAYIYDSKEEAEEDAEREMITYSAIAHIEWEE